VAELKLNPEATMKKVRNQVIHKYVHRSCQGLGIGGDRYLWKWRLRWAKNSRMD
jgi:hypothetical protein